MHLQFIQWGGGQPVALDFEQPTECPKCHKGIISIGVGNTGYVWPSDGGRSALYMFACPREECRNGFVALWVFDIFANGWTFRGAFPSTVEPSIKSRFIEGISPTFYTIFDQARGAEHNQLSEIAGMGYRKALEFLIKDYLSKEPTQALQMAQEEGDDAAVAAATRQLGAIREAPLSRVIEEQVADLRIRETAKRAAWLGNDAVHYSRRWEEHDIEDLRDLIALVTRFIESEESYKEMLCRMPGPA